MRGVMQPLCIEILNRSNSFERIEYIKYKNIVIHRINNIKQISPLSILYYY